MKISGGALRRGIPVERQERRWELVAGQRILLVVLFAWSLLMIVSDIWRVVQPLGSFGFYANNDGLIYNGAAFVRSLHRPVQRLCVGLPKSLLGLGTLYAHAGMDAAFPGTVAYL
jgi:hypothetical protein